MGAPWWLIALLYFMMVAGPIAIGVWYEISAVYIMLLLGFCTGLLTCVIIANRLVPARLRFRVISVMAAIFTIAAILRLIIQLLSR